MNFEGNPFFWGFTEQRFSKTLAQRTNATYNETREVVEQKTALENFFEQNVSHSPNPAHITGCTALEPQPYLVQSTSEEKEEEECKEETEQSTEQPVEEQPTVE